MRRSALIQLAAEAGAAEEDLDILIREARELRFATRASAMTRYSQLFNERLGQGRLLEPADDSAKRYVAELSRTDAGHPSTTLARQAFIARLVQEARTAAAADDFPGARRWLTEARAAGAEESAIANVEKEIATAQENVGKPSEIVSPTALNKLRHVDPEYPAAASSREINGWVDLELTVRANGTVGDIIVLRAQPAEALRQSGGRRGTSMALRADAARRQGHRATHPRAHPLRDEIAAASPCNLACSSSMEICATRSGCAAI